MYCCPNCNRRSEQPSNYCPNCGSAMTMVQEYREYYQPTTRKVPLAKKIVGMALSAFGLVMAATGVFETLLFAAAYRDIKGGLIAAIIFGLFSLPGSIIGLSISASNIANGDTSAFGKVGMILGIVGIGAAAFSFLLGLVT